MSRAERERWEARHAAGTAEAAPPSAFVLAWAQRLTPGPALDLGCGAGRHALPLARAGFTVTALDICAAALARVRERATQAGLTVACVEADLDDHPLPADAYTLIVSCQLLKRDVIAHYAEALRPGGAVLIEQHLATPAAVAGPSARHRLRPGELPGLLYGLRLLHYEETLVPAADGNTPLALVRAAAVREPWAF